MMLYMPWLKHFSLHLHAYKWRELLASYYSTTLSWCHVVGFEFFWPDHLQTSLAYYELLTLSCCVLWYQTRHILLGVPNLGSAGPEQQCKIYVGTYIPCVPRQTQLYCTALCGMCFELYSEKLICNPTCQDPGDSVEWPWHQCCADACKCITDACMWHSKIRSLMTVRKRMKCAAMYIASKWSFPLLCRHNCCKLP